MIDATLQCLLPLLRKHKQPALWLADENALGCASHLTPPYPGLTVICNRFDVNRQLTEAGFDSHFSDFDTQALQKNSFQQVFYRISKEKSVTHHLINLALQHLKPGGELILCGRKCEGIKTYFNKAKLLFPHNSTLEKVGGHYIARLPKNKIPTEAQISEQLLLDDDHYHRLRSVAQQNDITFYSKPGIFGWKKIDLGSAFLIQHLPSFLQGFSKKPHSLLDLGCGYGYLTLISAQLPLSRRVATDNNAAAIQAAQFNVNQLGLEVDIVADDCGASLSEPFDIILCNPPFHRGFSLDAELSNKFLSHTYRLLSPSGKALFVVNQFIPLERKTKAYGLQASTLTRNKSFRLVQLNREPS